VPAWTILVPWQYPLPPATTLRKPNSGEGSFFSYSACQDLWGTGTTSKANSVIYSKIKVGRTMNMKRG